MSKAIIIFHVIVFRDIPIGPTRIIFGINRNPFQDSSPILGTTQSNLRVVLSPKRGCGPDRIKVCLNPLRTAVSFWGQTRQILEYFVPATGLQS